jgi:hypothetical protein
MNRKKSQWFLTLIVVASIGWSSLAMPVTALAVPLTAAPLPAAPHKNILQDDTPPVLKASGSRQVLDAALSSVLVSGVVSDNAGHGYPLYAAITITTPGSTTTVYTDSFTGAYSVTLVQGTPYDFTVAARTPGYTPEVETGVIFTGATATKNFALVIDQQSCTAPGYARQYVWFQDFEANNGGFTAGGTAFTWAWGTPTSGPGAAHSGAKLWATNLAGPYNNSEDSSIVSGNIDLSAYTGKAIVVEWWQWVEVESGNDYIYADASKDGGATWVNFYSFTGFDTTWIQKSYTLDASYAVSNFQVRFRLTSDSVVNYAGFYVDDVGIGAVDAVLPPPLFSENFEGAAFPPTGWQVFDLDGSGATWDWSTLESRSPVHSVRHTFSNAGVQNGWLVTPPIALPANATVLRAWEKTLWPAYYAGHFVLVCDTSAAGGCSAPPTNYTQLAEWNDPAESWRQQSVSLSAYANKTVRIAFRYTGNDADDWYLDDFTIGWPIPPVACGLLQGGVVAGLVTDGNTTNGLVGVSVTSDTGAATLSVATPDDPNLPDGLYWLFQPGASAVYNFTAVGPAGYAAVTHAVPVVANAVTRQDFALPAGWLAANPTALETTVNLGASPVNQILNLANTGGLPATFTLQEIDQGFIPKNGVRSATPQNGVRSATPNVDVPWLSEIPTTGTIAPSTNTSITVTFDPTGITQPGNYHAALKVVNDTPYPLADIPVILHVSMPDTWGRISGVVAGLGLCDTAPGTPLVGATVNIRLPDNTLIISLTTLADGSYTYALLGGSYQLEVIMAGYVTQTGTVVVPGGRGTIIHNVDLSKVAPCIQASPQSLSTTLLSGATRTLTLTLTNTGASEGNFTIRELPRTAASSVQIPRFTGTITHTSPSIGRAPGVRHLSGATAADAVKVLTGAQAYAVDIAPGFVYGGFMSDAPDAWTVVGSVPDTSNFYGGTFLNGDFSKEYVVDAGTNTLYTLSTADASIVEIGPAAPGSGQVWMGLTASVDGILYAVATTCSSSFLYTLDPATGTPSLVGAISNGACIVDIAINANGDMYGVDITSDALISINPNTGAGSVVGSLGVDANYAQGMAFDQASGILYWAAYTTGGELRIIDTTTGASNLVGPFPGGAEVDSLSFTTTANTNVPWLSENPTTGVIPAGGSATVNVLFDAAGLTLNTYLADLEITNLPNPKIVIPVTLVVTELPAAPSGLTAFPFSQTQINLHWADNSFNEDGFKIERSLNGSTGWTQIDTVGAGVTDYSNTGLNCATPYFYRVRAYNGAGDSAYSSVANATTLVCSPAAPTSLTATTISPTQINLHWTDNSSNETGFKIERSPDGSTGWAQIGAVGPNVQDYPNTGLTCGTDYYYRVRAFNAGGDSAYSNVAHGVTVPCIPSAPTGLTAVPASQTQIDLHWTDNSNNEDGFKIERSPDGSTGWSEIGTVGPNVQDYPDTGLTCGTDYYYRVRAFNAGGDSAFTNVAHAVTAPCTPAAPTGLTAPPVSQTQIDLHWTDNSNNEDGFEVERSPDGSTGWSEIGTVGSNVQDYPDSGLTCGSDYYYRVRAYNAGGNSGYSNVAHGVTAPCIPAAPTELVITGFAQTWVSLQWTINSTTEDGFKVERSLDGATNWVEVGTVGVGVNVYTDPGLTAGTDYYYRVRAYSGAGNSDYSNVVHAKTKLYGFWLPYIANQ